MKMLGYKQCNADHTLLFKHSQTGGVTILIVYVNYIIITRDNDKEAMKLEEQLTIRFEVKKLGTLKYFLGIEVAQSGSGYLMTQQKYILDLLNETKLLQGKANSTPMETNHKLTLKKDDLTVEIGSYQGLIRRLLYLSHTRPYISYSVNFLTQFMHSLQKSHYHTALRILRYHKGTGRLGLTFRRTGKLNFEIYTNSDFSGSLIDRRPTTGYCAMLGGNLIIWRSKNRVSSSNQALKWNFKLYPVEMMKYYGFEEF